MERTHKKGAQTCHRNAPLVRKQKERESAPASITKGSSSPFGIRSTKNVRRPLTGEHRASVSLSIKVFQPYVLLVSWDIRYLQGWSPVIVYCLAVSSVSFGIPFRLALYASALLAAECQGFYFPKFGSPLIWVITSECSWVIIEGIFREGSLYSNVTEALHLYRDVYQGIRICW